MNAAEVHEAICSLDVDAIVDAPLSAGLTEFSILADAYRILAQIRSQLEQGIGARMDDKQVTVDGVATFVRHFKKDRTKWDKDDLLRVVLDSRVIDPDTGEIKDETPLDKVLAVWNLPAPRITALKARGIDADQFAHTERGGYQIEVLS